MKSHWIPLLKSDGPIPTFDHRTPHWSNGVVAVLANNADVFKLVVYAAPFLLLFEIYYSLYQSAERQRIVSEQRRIATLVEAVTGERLRGNWKRHCGSAFTLHVSSCFGKGRSRDFRAGRGARCSGVSIGLAPHPGRARELRVVRRLQS